MRSCTGTICCPIPVLCIERASSTKSHILGLRFVLVYKDSNVSTNSPLHSHRLMVSFGLGALLKSRLVSPQCVQDTKLQGHFHTAQGRNTMPVRAAVRLGPSASMPALRSISLCLLASCLTVRASPRTGLVQIRWNDTGEVSYLLCFGVLNRLSECCPCPATGTQGQMPTESLDRPFVCDSGTRDSKKCCSVLPKAPQMTTVNLMQRCRFHACASWCTVTTLRN